MPPGGEGVRGPAGGAGVWYHPHPEKIFSVLAKCAKKRRIFDEMTNIELSRPKTDGVMLMAGYCRLLDEGGRIHFGQTEHEACESLVTRLSEANGLRRVGEV